MCAKGSNRTREEFGTDWQTVEVENANVLGVGVSVFDQIEPRENQRYLGLQLDCFKQSSLKPAVERGDERRIGYRVRRGLASRQPRLLQRWIDKSGQTPSTETPHFLVRIRRSKRTRT